MNAVVKELHPLMKQRDSHGPGVIRVHSGKLVDLANPQPDDFLIEDIAWALGSMVRYNGHIPHPYTVARHSIVMSHYVPREYAMEALLHDAGEAYCGDIIHPLKMLYPELEKFEDNITGVIHQKFNKGKNVYGRDAGDHQYQKSDVISHADLLIYEHECHRFGRPGQYVYEMHMAENEAIKNNGLGQLTVSGIAGDREAFLARFHELNQ